MNLPNIVDKLSKSCKIDFFKVLELGIYEFLVQISESPFWLDILALVFNSEHFFDFLETFYLCFSRVCCLYLVQIPGDLPSKGGCIYYTCPNYKSRPFSYQKQSHERFGQELGTQGYFMETKNSLHFVGIIFVKVLACSDSIELIVTIWRLKFYFWICRATTYNFKSR